MKGIRKLLKSVLVMAIAFSLFSSSLANGLVGNPTKAEAYYDNLYVIDLRPGVSYSAPIPTNKILSSYSEYPQIFFIYMLRRVYIDNLEMIERTHDRLTLLPHKQIIEIEYDPSFTIYAAPGCSGERTYDIDELFFSRYGFVDFQSESIELFDKMTQALELKPRTNNKNLRYTQFRIIFDDIKDRGTYTMDFSKGDVYVAPIDYLAVCTNINKQIELGNMRLTEFIGYSHLDLDNDGTDDISIKYSQTDDIQKLSGVFSKLDTCSVKNSFDMTCSIEDVILFSPFPKDLSYFFSKINFVFPKPEVSELPPSVNEQIEASKNDYLDGSLKAPVLKSVEAKNKTIKVAWKKLKSKDIKRIDGYEIQISTSKNFSKDVKLVVVQKKKTFASIKKLKNGRKYYVRIRSIKHEGGQKHFSNWSKKKSVSLQKIKGVGKNI